MRCILYYDPQNPRSEERGFFICAASDNEVLAMLEMKLRQGANDVMLRIKDVGLRPMTPALRAMG